MKRYMLFTGEEYYAKGGMHDFVMSDNNPKELSNYAKEKIEKDLIDWWHIYDTKECKIIEKSKDQSYGAEE